MIMFIHAARARKASSHITIALIALGLTSASFAWQPFGPEIGQQGTECIPIEDCFAPLRGGGFPAQYVIDIPLITFHAQLGIEDEFRIWPFVLDVIFYVALGEAVHRLYLYYTARQWRS